MSTFASRNLLSVQKADKEKEKKKGEKQNEKEKKENKEKDKKEKSEAKRKASGKVEGIMPLTKRRKVRRRGSATVRGGKKKSKRERQSV